MEGINCIECIEGIEGIECIEGIEGIEGIECIECIGGIECIDGIACINCIKGIKCPGYSCPMVGWKSVQDILAQIGGGVMDILTVEQELKSVLDIPTNCRGCPGMVHSPYQARGGRFWKRDPNGMIF